MPARIRLSAVALLACFAANAVVLSDARVQAAPPNPGPDVVVGNLIDTQSYGSEVAPNGILAFDVGTVSCNIGNVDLQWVGATNQHPVIAQNIYRLKNGRIEHIGLSWVKHGFFALTGNLCGTCNGVGGSVLGVGCSDPYDSGLNGLQNGLGPRSPINPTTGAFVYDSSTPATWPAIGTSRLARRIQINQTEIDPALNPGALYFAEAVYITPDDAAAGNGFNNASYRQIRFFGSPSPVSGFPSLATTQRSKPAIFAWRDYSNGVTSGGLGIADSSVTLVPIDIPGDGRIWIGAKVIANPDATYRYEYAIYNLNSDRAVGGLYIPLPTGSPAPTAINTRVPVHHSGEPYSTAQWTSSIVGPSIRFSVDQPFATNPNANALRWGTLGNFGFISSVAPAPGSAAVVFFKPGTGPHAPLSSLSISLPTPGGQGLDLSVPTPDNCATPAVAHHGANGFTILGAGAIGTDPCTGSPAAPDVYFTYTLPSQLGPSCPGPLVFDTCGSSFATRLSVYAGASCPGAAPLACQDDVEPCGAGTSRVSVPAVAGSTYLIRVARVSGASGSSGNGVLNITAPFCLPPIGACCAPAGNCLVAQGVCPNGTFLGVGTTCSPNPCPQPPVPTNDRCNNALPVGDGLVGGMPAVGRTNGAGTDSVDSCFGSGSSDVWYAYTPAQTGNVVLDTCTPPVGGAAFDTVLSIRPGCEAAEIACNDDTCGTFSRLSFALSGGQRYLVRVAGFGGAAGDFALRVSGGGGIAGTVGACCRGSTCAPTDQAGCTGTFSRFAGASTTCSPSSGPASCCRADFSQDGLLDVDDIFIFLNAWFAVDPAAAMSSNGNSQPSIDDVFIFLNAWFARC